MGTGDFVYSPGGAISTNLPVGTPSTPTTGDNLGSVVFAHRAIPVWQDPAAQTWAIQDGLWWNNAFAIVHPTSSSSLPTVLGLNINTTADTSTISHVALAVTSRYTRTPRTLYTPQAAAINRGAGMIPANLVTPAWYRGDAVGRGGFFYYLRFSVDVYTATNRAFFGLMGTSGSTTAMWSGPTNTSSVAGDYIGLGMDTLDTAFSLMTRDNATTTKTAITGIPATASQTIFLDFYLYAQPNDSVIYYRVDNLIAGTTLVDTSISTTIPRNTIFMAPMAAMSTGTTITTGAVPGISKVYIIGQNN